MSKKLNFGPMDEKCFISRSELLQWINNLLLVSLTKVEQLGSGNIYCQLFDVIYPGKIPLNKLKWKAKHEYEFNHNFKLLQKGFDSVQVAKAIPIEKLVKVKYQDNLEFAQWMKRFFELNCKDKGKGYDAKKRRGFQEPDLSFCGGGVLPQYTMIYGNFKDMEREIVQKSEDEENENDVQSKGYESNLGNGIAKRDLSSNTDKENINNNNISKIKQEPLLQKYQKTNSNSKNQKASNELGMSYLNQQQKLQQSLSPFNPIVATMLLKQQQGSERILQSINQASEYGVNNECPFFMNNNQVNKYPTLNFQNSSNNITLLKQLENKDEQPRIKTPSTTDKLFNDSIMNSGGSNSSQVQADPENCNNINLNESYNKIEQIKQVLLPQQIESNNSIDSLIQIINSIKSIIY